MDIERALKNIGDWISRETESRKYPKSELLELSESLQALNEAIARQSATSEEVVEAIVTMELLDMITLDWEKTYRANPCEQDSSDLMKRRSEDISLAITALQAYEPWIPVSERLPDGDVASVLIHTNKGGVSEGQYYPCIKSWKQFRWSVEDADVTHWKPLPEPPKGE